MKSTIQGYEIDFALVTSFNSTDSPNVRYMLTVNFAQGEPLSFSTSKVDEWLAMLEFERRWLKYRSKQLHDLGLESGSI